LRAVVTAHASAISYESVDVLLERTPILDLRSLQQKMIAGARAAMTGLPPTIPTAPIEAT
jgi:arylamine N-acetyltransferase